MNMMMMMTKILPVKIKNNLSLLLTHLPAFLQMNLVKQTIGKIFIVL